LLRRSGHNSHGQCRLWLSVRIDLRIHSNSKRFKNNVDSLQ
jgi:hypothetical protein